MLKPENETSLNAWPARVATLRGKVEVRGALAWGDQMARRFTTIPLHETNILTDQPAIYVFNHTTHPSRFFRKFHLFPDVSLLAYQVKRLSGRDVAIVAQYNDKPATTPEGIRRQKQQLPYQRLRMEHAGNLIPLNNAPNTIDREFLPAAIAAKEAGKSILIAGTYVRRGKNALDDPKTQGAAKLALELQMPIVPVYIEFPGLETSSWKIGTRVHMSFGEAIFPSTDAKGKTQRIELADKITDSLRRQQASMYASSPEIAKVSEIIPA